MKKINVNIADKESLMTLPGIDEKLANAILHHRSEVGEFQTLEDLKKVKGVTERLFAQFSPILSIGKSKQGRVESQSIHVFGTPGLLMATLPVPEGITERKRTEVRFQDTNLLDTYAQPLIDISRRKRIIPGRTRLFSVSIPLAPTTPPGIYKMKIMVDDFVYDTTLEILEEIDVQVQPESITILSAPSKTVEKVIYIANRGNIPLDFDDMGTATLQGQSIGDNIVRGVVRNFEKSKDLHGIFNLTAKELEKIYEDAGVLRFKMKEGKQSIEPGETKRLTIVFTMPANLRHSQQYFTRLQFYNSSLGVTVFPSKSS